MAEKWLRLAQWPVLAVFLIGLPLVFPGSSAVSTFSYLGIMALFALSYNVLLGQTGLLSLGHGMFFGFGGFFTVLAFNLSEQSGINIPLPVLPLFGAVGAAIFGVLFGSIVAGRGGMAFAMITLGLGELVHAASFILPSFFGGEEGKGIDRTMTGNFLGYDFGPQVEVYYIIAFWFFVSALCLYFVTRTPFGLLANAVRENSLRVEFVGFKPSRIRFIAFVISAFFAGIAGGLAAINFEVMTTTDISAIQSTLVLLMTYIGGIQQFFGPVIGAVVIGAMKIWLSDITPAWQLYFGILFIFVVMFVPEGLVGILTNGWAFLRSGRFGRLLPETLVTGIAGLATATGLSMLVELGYRAGLNAAEGSVLDYFGVALDTASLWSWALALALLVGGFFAVRKATDRFTEKLHVLQSSLTKGEDRKSVV
jgi:branched-chain amino acid transport system permease protein